MDDFDWRNPDYGPILQRRLDRLVRIRANPETLPALKAYYRENIADFINDWGMTHDPRNIERGLPAYLPFLLFLKQREWIDEAIAHWRGQKPLLTEKSRDCGLSWLTVAVGASLCLFHDDMNIGFGSRKEEYVDSSTDPKSLFHKARMFIGSLPPEFRGGWDAKRHSSHMRIWFPSTRSTMNGEAGDNIGRGDRAAIYFVDESAFLPRPAMVDASLSQTTNCRIDVSSVNGLGNTFAQRRHGGKVDVFIFDWRDDPRKDQAWYDRQVAQLDATVVAAEIDRDYMASVEGTIIPGAWIRSAVDAHRKLNFEPSGASEGALDVADEGSDKCAFAGGTGPVIQHLEEWSGRGDDIFGTTERAISTAERLGYSRFRYDADGLGAAVRGDARVINARRQERGLPMIDAIPWRGSDGVVDPQGEDVEKRKNLDYFANRKAQEWWSLRRRFERTHRAVTQGEKFNPDDLISIPSELPLREKLIAELAQPTATPNGVGKMVVNKAPDGTKSPNLADAVMIRFARVTRGPMQIPASVLARAGPRRR